MLYKDTNQIKRNYYLNLFSTNAEIKKSPYSIASVSGSVGGNGNQNQNQNQNGGGGNGNQNQNQNQGGNETSTTSTNNNWIYEWNIRDLQLERYAEIALVQIANNKADYTEERQYPPKAFNSSTNEITSSNDIFNIAPVPYYKQTITLNTTGITYGSGTYELYSSSVYDAFQLFGKKELFNYNLNDAGGAVWANGNYTNGVYNTTNNFIVNGYFGDWIVIKLPSPIILSKFAFVLRVSGVPDDTFRTPAEWRCYGSNDGITFNEITEASNLNRLTLSDYIDRIYTKTLTNFNTPYLYIGWTFNKTLPGASQLLHFTELQIFGREPITRIKQRLTEEREYPPKAFTSSTNEITTTGELSNILPTTFYKQIITLNTTGISYGSGDYILYCSSSFLSGTLYQKRDLFNYNLDDVGGAFYTGNYATVNGLYNGPQSYIKSDYEGDWIIIKLPNPIILTKFRFYARAPSNNLRSPGLWKCYGSNDGINFTEITQASNDTIRLITNNYPNNMYEQALPTFNTPYLYIGFTIQRLVGNSNLLNFAELRLFGKEEIKLLTEERQYPPKAYNSATEEATTTEILNKTSYIEKLIVNTNGINYGNGVYNVYSSSIYISANTGKKFLFNHNTTDDAAHFSTSSYTANDGNYTGNNFIVSGYTGDWVVIKLISPIILSRFRFYANLNPPFDLKTRSPGLWRCYGSNDGINFTEITEASNDITSIPSSTYNTFYEKTLTTFNIPYLYIGWTINKLVGGNIYANILNFSEIQIFGKEIVPDKNIYTIKSLNCYNDGWDSTTTTNATLFMSNELVSNKQPTYHKLNSYNLNRITLEVSDDIEEKTRNGWDNNIEFGCVLHIKNYKDT
jgi:hypothetical protein